MVKRLTKQVFKWPRELDRPGAVRFWTDYLKARLEPRSVLQVPGVWQGGDELVGYGSGRLLDQMQDVLEEATDRVRLLAEECDHLQVSQQG